MLSGEGRDEEHVKGGGIGFGLVELAYHEVELLRQVEAGRHGMERYAQVLGRAPGVREVVDHSFGPGVIGRELDRETLQGSAAVGSRQRDDGAGIESSREERTHRHVGDHLASNGGFKSSAGLVRQGFGGIGAGFLSEGNAVKRPLTADTAVAHEEGGARFQFGNALERGARGGAPEVGEVLSQGYGIGRMGQGRVLEEGLEFAGEQESSGVFGEVKGLDAEAVTGEEELCVAGVPEREGEHSLEKVEHFDSVLAVEGEEDFRIGAAPEGGSSSFQGGAELEVVVDFAVEDDTRSGVGIPHGLVSRGSEVEDGEAPVSERQPAARVAEEALVIGPAVGEPASHSGHEIGGEVSPGAGDAAHVSFPPRTSRIAWRWAGEVDSRALRIARRAYHT